MNQSQNFAYRAALILRVGLCSSLAVCAMTFVGCEAPKETAKEPKQQPVIGRKTNDIGEFDPAGTAVVADLQVSANASPIGAAGGAYTFAVGQTSTLMVQQAINLFQAEHGRFPKDHAEFMERIVKPNNIMLPVLPGKRQYQYDVANHKLVVVEAPKSD